MVVTTELIAIGIATMTHGGMMVWKLSQVVNEQKNISLRLEKLEKRIFNGEKG